MTERHRMGGTLAIGADSVASSERLYIFEDEETSNSIGVLSELEKNSSGSKGSHYCFSGDINHTGDDNASAYIGLEYTCQFETSSGKTLSTFWGVSVGVDSLGSSDSITNFYGYTVSEAGDDGSIGTFYGYHISDISGPSVTKAYGLYVGNMRADTNYGVYIASQSTGTGNGYGIYIDACGGVGANSYAVYIGNQNGWGIYQSSSNDKNYFAGNIAVRSTASSILSFVLSLNDQENTLRNNYEASINYDASITGITSAVGYLVNADIDQSGSFNYIYGLYNDIDVTSAVTAGDIFCVNNNVRIDNASASLDTIRCVSNQVVVADASVTTVYGVSVGIDKTGTGSITTGYGLYIGNVGATSGWGVYQTGSDDKNFFNGQTGFGTSGINADALVEFSSTTKAVLLTRVTTTQMNNIVTPVNGMIVYNSSLGKVYVYSSGWVALH